MSELAAVERAVKAIEMSLEAIAVRLDRIDRSLETLVNETGQLHHARVMLVGALERLSARLTIETGARQGSDETLEKTVDVLEGRVSRIGNAVVDIEKRESERPPPKPEEGTS